MKNSKKLIVIFILLLMSQKIYSQKWDVLGNTTSGGEFIGPLPSSTYPLELRTYPALDINFYTNYSSVTTPRATITSGGDVGIGTTTPLTLLHQHGSGNTTYHTFTNTSTVLGGLEIGMFGNLATIRQRENASIMILTHTARRMEIGHVPTTYYGAISELTRVSISQWGQPIAFPKALLHLGDDYGAGSFGTREWMDYGTFTDASSDFMYVGLKDENSPTTPNVSDKMDAVINWGDNEDVSADMVRRTPATRTK